MTAFECMGEVEITADTHSSKRTAAVRLVEKSFLFHHEIKKIAYGEPQAMARFIAAGLIKLPKIETAQRA